MNESGDTFSGGCREFQSLVNLWVTGAAFVSWFCQSGIKKQIVLLFGSWKTR